MKKVYCFSVFYFFLLQFCESQSCNNWLNTPTLGSSIGIGDLDVSGNKITVEAVINRTAPYSGGNLYAGDVVSKHTDPTDCNYLLRPNSAEITTTNGYFITPSICAIDLNKTYHIAMVYDGATLKFYRDGYLMSQVSATGNLFQNNFDTRIGYYAAQLFNTQFLGYINEVRIWNVARTQTQIQAFMNSSLPNPTTQTGLLGYYTFDNLLNKQGNSTFNGTINGGATINATNPVCNLVVDSCGSVPTTSCNDWLNTPSQPSYVNIGSLDVSGNKITVEASFNTTLNNGGFGDLVSKHKGTNDCNYLLRAYSGEITTSNGYYIALADCPVQANKTYHVAMVYDGALLKFYRNGFLMKQVPASGNLVLNSWQTWIGYFQPQTLNENFTGYINEVRIWNIARTQSQIQAYMNSSLPTPTSQTGLLAYYIFTDLLNKQGNAAWNGTLGGAATINSTNPNCSFVADSCPVNTLVSNIINQYTPVLSLDPCKNILTVGDGTAFNTGDTVLLIQMKGAVIDSTNTASFGTITNYKNAGNYEFNYVKSKSGNNIELKNTLTRNYDLPNGKVQLIRVPYYQKATVTSTLTCPPWNGSTGGVLVFNVADSLVLNANIDVSGKGFSGGTGFNSGSASLSCFQNNYNYSIANNAIAGQKGESITTISQNIICGKGNPAGGGGAGLGHNSGGGGGGNGGHGGFGGYQLDACGNSPYDNRGIGGLQLAYATSTNKIFMGSGGGAGQADNPGNIPPGGGNGGGMIIISSNFIKSNSFKISANGNPGVTCSIPASPDCHDGMGGGGAGGTVLLNINQVLDNTTVETKGGKGTDMIGSVALGGRVAAGGGGGGGLLFVNTPAVPANITNTNTGGANGVLTTDGNNPWGATPGQTGQTLLNLVLPVDGVPFKVNIDSVRFNFSSTSCSNINFLGSAYVNTTPVATWFWDFGDGNFGNTQNVSHNYGTAGTYTVKLVITDNNGCKDSISKPVVITAVSAFDFSYKQNVCNPLSVQFTGIGASLVNPYWSFGDAGTTTGTTTPTHTYAATGNYLVKFTVTNAGCNDTISKIISVNIVPADIIITPDTTICFGTTKQLRTQPSLSFCWSPTTYLNNPLLPNPVTSAPGPITYYFTAETIGTNLITNGDFSGGNTGFTSGYNYAPTNTTEGEYFVGANPQAWNASLSNCADHTTGNGNMLLVNGAPVANIDVWRQTVTVTPNTNYAFSTWIQALYPPNPAQLSFSINGYQAGNLITASLPTCTWSQFYTTWNSGNNTTATISIVNKNTIVLGNDFALDDISFAPVTIKRDSVKISVDTPKVAALSSTAVCSGIPVQLLASGASTYSWLPATGLSSANIANPIATPATTTSYIATGTTIHGCVAQSLPIIITVLQRPVITKSNDTTICKASSVQLFASGGTNYTWTPAATLNNPNIPNPVASPTAPVTKYYVMVINNALNTCSNTDSVKVTLKADPVFTVSPSKTTCLGTAVQLNASGGDVYLWSPAGLVTNPAIANPFTSTSSTINYSVTITESVCNVSKTLSTLVTVNPTPQVTATKSNDIDCSIEFSNLLATGASQYIWTPAASLNNSIIANPVARPTTTTQYIVQGINAYGCSGADTLTVAVTVLGKSGYNMPNTFTPNGDGINDCFGIKYWGIIQQLEFFIYNRYGERVFYTTDPNQCWDGTYKGARPLPGNYVYYIKAKTACGTVERKGNVLLIR